MLFVIHAKAPDGADDTFAIADRTEALRFALDWHKTGYKRVQVAGDGRRYTLREFAGTILIGEKRIVSQ
jgi:hypothetical protein